MIFINILLLIGTIDAKEHPYNFWKPPVQQKHGNDKDNVKEDRRLSTFKDFNDDYNYNHVYQQPRDNSYNYNRNYDYEFYNDYPQTPLQKITDFLGYGNNKFKSGNPFQEIDRQLLTVPPNIIFAAVVGSVAAAGVAAQTGLLDELNNFLNPTTTTTSAPTTTAFAIRTCIDGIKNGEETDIDCGGDCQACVSGSVSTTITTSGSPSGKRRRRSLFASSRQFATDDAFDEYKAAFKAVMANHFDHPFKDITAKRQSDAIIEVTFDTRDPSETSDLTAKITKANGAVTELSEKLKAKIGLTITMVSEAKSTCKSSDACAGNSNICTNEECKCGMETACTTGSTLASCMKKDGTSAAESADTDATCQCSGSGTEQDLCYVADNENFDAKTPICGTGTDSNGLAVGKCGKCLKEDFKSEGDGTTKGTCPDAAKMCTNDGSCKCQKEKGKEGAGDGKVQGTCAETYQMCTADGECMCQKEKGVAGPGDGSTQGTCDTNMVCCKGGECAANKDACS